MIDLVESTAGLALVAGALFDLFITVFNYDGFTFVAGRFQRLFWTLLRTWSRLVPGDGRHAVLSIGSAAMLPATVALWLAAEICGFSLIFLPGLAHHAFHLSDGVVPGTGSALYLSAGAITSLTFGDLIAKTGPYQAALVVETVIGLATFTLALGYVVTTFGILETLDKLHNTVRRHASDPHLPSSILTRHYRGGEPSELPGFLQSLSDLLEDYDEGLRRYPVVYYFHTRRVDRSIPRIFWILGELLAQLRWGLPASEAMVDDPWLAALLSQYGATVDRLRRSFVGPESLGSWPRAGRAEFVRVYLAAADGGGDRPRTSPATFWAMQARARSAAGLGPPPDPDLTTAYQRYLEWREFDHRRDVILSRVAQRLGYDEAPPEPPTHLTQRPVGLRR